MFKGIKDIPVHVHLAPEVPEDELHLLLPPKNYIELTQFFIDQGFDVHEYLSEERGGHDA